MIDKNLLFVIGNMGNVLLCVKKYFATVVLFNTKLPYKFFELVIRKHECLILNLRWRYELPVILKSSIFVNI